jgi:hypothetical protein
MGANMVVKYVLPGSKTIFVSLAKLTNFSCWVLAQTTQDNTHIRSPPLPSKEACLLQTCPAPFLPSPTGLAKFLLLSRPTIRQKRPLQIHYE